MNLLYMNRENGLHQVHATLPHLLIGAQSDTYDKSISFKPVKIKVKWTDFDSVNEDKTFERDGKTITGIEAIDTEN